MTNSFYKITLDVHDNDSRLPYQCRRFPRIRSEKFRHQSHINRNRPFSAASGYFSLPLAGNMEINTFRSNGSIVIQMNTAGERIFSSDVYVTIYYTKD